MRLLFCIGILAAAGAVGLTPVVKRREVLKLFRDLLIVMSVGAAYEITWILKLAEYFALPGTGAQFAGNHPLIMLVLDILPPAMIAALVWTLLRRLSWHAAFMIVAVAALAALMSTVAVDLMYLRGVAEAVGLLRPLSHYHLSGVYNFSVARNISYVLVTACVGAFVVNYSDRARR